METLRKFVILATFLMLSNGWTAFAQLPGFQIVRNDLSKYGTKDLDKSLPVLFMYFSPTCPECQEMTEVIISHLAELKPIQIVMISFESVTAIKSFALKYKTDLHDNLVIGTEGNTFLFPKNFHIEKLPFLVFYDNKGKLVLKYNSKMPAQDFIKEVIYRGIR